jgi:hypothetical protein
MAKLTDRGSVISRCPGCDGSLSTFEWAPGAPAGPHGFQGLGGAAPTEYGTVRRRHTEPGGAWYDVLFKLFRCAGCGRGGLGAIRQKKMTDVAYPGGNEELLDFYPEARERLKLPAAVPQGIRNEFAEAEQCLEAGCLRAAAGLFRSVLDKTMRANGYKLKGMDLYKQIEAAATDGVLTESRKKRAHEDIRVLGNDVLHDEWEPVSEEAVELAHHYAQRILEDFYDDRDTILGVLRAKGRVPDEDRPPP